MSKYTTKQVYTLRNLGIVAGSMSSLPIDQPKSGPIGVDGAPEVNLPRGTLQIWLKRE